jgi:hypothetical protein
MTQERRRWAGWIAGIGAGVLLLHSVHLTAAIQSISAMLWSYEGDANGDEVGAAVTTGDVNGDEVHDIIIGAPGDEAATENEGVVHIFYEDAVIVSTHLGSGVKGAQFGAALSTGDVNGDDIDDLVVGAPAYKSEVPNIGKTGAALLYLGTTSGISATATWSYQQETETFKESELGAAVDTADVNDDTYADILVGAPHYSNGQSNEGAVFLFHGTETGPSSSPQWTWECDQSSARCGADVAAAGDVNGDGFDDVLIGAPSYEETFAGEGAAFLFLGAAAGITDTLAWAAYGEQPDATFGAAVSSAGDVNQDGFDDVLVGAPTYTCADDTVGALFLYLGSSAGLATSPSQRICGQQAGAQFGAAVAAAGDVNADGYADVIVGAPFYDSNETTPDNKGTIYVYYGTSIGLYTDVYWQELGGKSETEFGAAVNAAQDHNGDGYPDVLVGAPGYKIDSETNDAGQVLIYGGTEEAIPIYYSYLPLIQHQ